METKKKKENSKPHFTKVIDYAPEETWRTDVLIGQKDSEPHGHLALSGSAVWYLRDEEGKEIVVDGNVIQSSKEPKSSEQPPSENEDNSDSTL